MSVRHGKGGLLRGGALTCRSSFAVRFLRRPQKHRSRWLNDWEHLPPQVTGLTGGPQMPSAERRRLPTDSKSRQTRNLNPHPFPTGTTSRSATRRNLCSLAFHRPAMGEPFPSGTILGATTSRASDQHPKVEPTDRQTSSATRRTLSHLPKLIPLQPLPDPRSTARCRRAVLHPALSGEIRLGYNRKGA
jgi:hypothetical protein